ncbi:MAG: glycosyltransferase [Acidimicrobiia bacterium]|nr:glycosyltransferase [Acidimicrobiia bacterium]
MHEVDVTPMDPERLVPFLRSDRAEEFRTIVERGRRRFAGRTVWNVSSTAAGGGVAEMLHRLVRYAKGAGVDSRWVVIDGTADFFAVTKRLHNRLHGEEGDNGELGDRERQLSQDVVADNAGPLMDLLAPEDIVLVHDPQPAGLLPVLRDRGIVAVWRCHVGTETTNEWTDDAWAFLRPSVETAAATVFSRAEYVPAWVPHDKVRIIPPAIDPLSAKNQPLDDHAVLAILGRAGIVDHSGDGAEFVDTDDRRRTVELTANVRRVGSPLSPDVPVLLQVSRWDRLKDMSGVLRAFVDGAVGGETGAHLFLVGPDVTGVTDDPEGKQVLDECVAMWEQLPAATRATASLISLPMDDLEQNAAIVNALQRHAAAVAQKSLREGFGLTVAEAMWKARPVIGSAVGGIQDQVRDGVDGLLISDPHDLGAFASAARTLLGDRASADRMGSAAHERVRDNFLADRDLGQWTNLLGDLAVGD